MLNKYELWGLIIYTSLFRILNVCKKFLSATTKAQDMAYYVTSIYLTRPDVKDSYLPEFIQWAHEVVSYIQ